MAAVAAVVAAPAPRMSHGRGPEANPRVHVAHTSVADPTTLGTPATMAAGRSRDGDQVTDRRQLGFADPGDIEQVLDRLERAVRLAMGDDLAGDDRTNAGRPSRSTAVAVFRETAAPVREPGWTGSPPGCSVLAYRGGAPMAGTVMCSPSTTGAARLTAGHIGGSTRPTGGGDGVGDPRPGSDRHQPGVEHGAGDVDHDRGGGHGDRRVTGR